jgi:hypothetical protein
VSEHDTERLIPEREVERALRVALEVVRRTHKDSPRRDAVYVGAAELARELRERLELNGD